jgi:hypothetical protein
VIDGDFGKWIDTVQFGCHFSGISTHPQFWQIVAFAAPRLRGD